MRSALFNLSSFVLMGDKRLYPDLPCAAAEQTDWSLSTGAEPKDPRMTSWPCQGTHTVSSYTSNRFGVWLTCERCAFRLDYAPNMGCSGKYRKEPKAALATVALRRLQESGDTPTAARVEAHMKAIEAER
eukprot:3872479-Pyramimonas_sp.AAC.1